MLAKKSEKSLVNKQCIKQYYTWYSQRELASPFAEIDIGEPTLAHQTSVHLESGTSPNLILLSIQCPENPELVDKSEFTFRFPKCKLDWESRRRYSPVHN